MRSSERSSEPLRVTFDRKIAIKCQIETLALMMKPVPGLDRPCCVDLRLRAALSSTMIFFLMIGHVAIVAFQAHNVHMVNI